MENSGIAVQRTIVRSDTCGIGWTWPSSDAARIITWFGIGKTWAASQGVVHAWRQGGTDGKRPACSTRMSCHLTEPPKMLFS